MAQAWTPPDYVVKEETTKEKAKDPVEEAKKTLAWTPPTYTQDNSEDTPPPAVKKEEPSTLGRVWNFLNKPLTDAPSRFVDKPAESLMKYGESGDDLLHKASLYGGGFLKEVGDAVSGLSSPLNIGTTLLSSGASLAENRGLNSIASALETPAKLASAEQAGHGVYKAYNADNATDRVSGLAEAAIGALGTRGRAEHESENVNSGPKDVASISEPKIKKSAFDFPEGPDKERFYQLVDKESKGTLTADELKEAQSLNTKLRGLGRTKELLQNAGKSKFSDSTPIATDEPLNGDSKFKAPTPSIGGKEDKPRVRLILDDEGRVLGHEPISIDRPRPSQFNVDKSIETGKPEIFTPPDYALKPEEIPAPLRPDTESSLRQRAIIDRLNSDEVSNEKFTPPDYALKSDESPNQDLTPQDTPPEATFSHFDTDGKPKFHVGETGSDLPAEELTKQGIAIPQVPLQISQIPAPIKSILDNAGIDSSKMDVTTAVNKARELNGQESTTAPLTDSQPTDSQSAQVAPQDSIDKLKAAIQQSSANRQAQDTSNASERSFRAGKLQSINTPGLAGHIERGAALKGEYPNIPVESQLSQEDVNGLIDHIQGSHLQPYDKFSASNGLIKLMSGKTIAPYQSKLIGQVFGSDMEELIHLHGGLGAPGLGGMVSDVVNVPKTLMATMDLSAPLRQGIGLIHRKEYWNAFSDMFKYAGSSKAYEALKQNISERPNFELGNKSGLYLADVGEQLSHREEQFMSHYAEQIPVFGRLVKGSERAYTGFLNKLRSDTYDSLIQHAKDMGQKVENVNVLEDGTKVSTPTKIATDIAKYVNNSTGRGSLGRFEKNAVELNSALFSPRLISSRLTMLNPKYYINLEPTVRKEALKSLFAIAGAGVTVNALGAMAGGKLNANPTSSDFGKIKFGNSRIDPLAGFQQPIVAAARLISGKDTSTNGTVHDLSNSKFPNPTRLSVIGNFARSKESPIASFIDSMLSGPQAFPPGGLGAKFGANRPSAEIINRFTPMLINDLMDLHKSDPNLMALGIPAAFGMGLQTIDEKPPKGPFRLAFNKMSLKP